MKRGLLQALGVAAYISLVALFMSSANSVFPKLGNFVAPILFLLLFSVSVMTCGLLVFYKPYKMFFAGKKKEAVSVVISTAVWLFVFLAILLLVLLVLK